MKKKFLVCLKDMLGQSQRSLHRFNKCSNLGQKKKNMLYRCSDFHDISVHLVSPSCLSIYTFDCFDFTCGCLKKTQKH